MAELEAKIETLLQLEEQHLLCIDQQSEQIAKLKTELAEQKKCYRIVAKNLMTYSKITKELRSRIAELEAEIGPLGSS